MSFSLYSPRFRSSTPCFLSASFTPPPILSLFSPSHFVSYLTPSLSALTLLHLPVPSPPLLSLPRGHYRCRGGQIVSDRLTGRYGRSGTGSTIGWPGLADQPAGRLVVIKPLKGERGRQTRGQTGQLAHSPVFSLSSRRGAGKNGCGHRRGETRSSYAAVRQAE